jgi:hypothetical protein
MMIREEDQKCILMIGEIGIFLQSIPTKVSMTITREEVMQEESEEVTSGTNCFKSNNLCIAGVEDRKQTTTIMEEKKEKTLISSQEMDKGNRKRSIQIKFSLNGRRS